MIHRIINKKYFTFIFILFLLLYYLFNYRTTYDEYDISPLLREVRETLNKDQELVVFNSKNPFNFYDIINNMNIISNQNVYGIITYPKETKEKYPLIIGIAGSKGWSDHHYSYLDNYNNNGIATLSLHSFESRGVSETVGEQVSVTIPMIICDAYAALDEVSKINKIDVNNVGITGWSLGGGVSLYSAWKKIKDILSPNLTFKAHLPFYPPCISNVNDIDFLNVPIHILIGELDEWTPSIPCENIINSLYNDGHDVNITVFPNSHHSFDRKQNIIISENAYSLKDCKIKLSNDGTVKTERFNFPLSNSFLQKIGLFMCADRGPRYGGNDIARKEAAKISLDFFNKYLK